MTDTLTSRDTGMQRRKWVIVETGHEGGLGLSWGTGRVALEAVEAGSVWTRVVATGFEVLGESIVVGKG